MRKQSKTESTLHLPAALATQPNVETSQGERGPHRVEEEVQRTLLSHPRLHFSTLVIRRIPDGVCLEGVLEVENDCPDVCRLARSVSGVQEVLNHLVVRKPPAKG